ncbi:MAG: hypothetical protein DPW09_22415 [Anaerolineae bacterium]|nr:hypothetical protein [Anaerolineales bacterium]MCQ3976191.1 hypothetical protein [Anaerolineae bacterium]
MFHKNSSNRTKLAAIAVIAMIVLIVVSGVAAASSNCKKVNGKLILNPDTTGSYKGDIKGDSAFTGTSFTPTDIPDVAVLTGNNIIHTNKGDLMTQDAIVLRTTGAGEFAEVDTVVGGTGDWAGVTGVIQAIGTFTFEAGGTGNYSGQICAP